MNINNKDIHPHESRNPPVSCLCFSKDRPFQLDGYIRSLRRAFSCPVDLTVLYKSTDNDITVGFQELAEQHPDTHFIPETDFGNQVLNWLNHVPSELVFFGCDDVVFHRPIDFQTVATTFQGHDLIGFSLRLGRNIRFNHTRDDEVPKPAFHDDASLLCWNWRDGEADWGYPFEVNGTVYRTTLVKLLFEALENIRTQLPQADWRHPNFIENASNQLLRNLKAAPPQMASFHESCLVVPTVNQVQNIAWNHIMGTVRSVSELEQWRRSGQQMDVNAYQNAKFDRIHIGDFFVTNPVSNTPKKDPA